MRRRFSTLICHMRFNEYRIVWILVLFDLPTETKRDVRNYAKFRKSLIKDGFSMFQFSTYLRHCASRENMTVHTRRVKSNLPPKGHVGILGITDKQFASMEIFSSGEVEPTPTVPQQLEMF